MQARRKHRDKYIDDLEDKKQDLINIMRDKSAELEKDFSTQSYNSINTYANTHLNYDYPLDDLNMLNEKYVAKNDQEYQLDEKKKNLDNAVEKMISDLKDRVKNISFNDLKGAISGFAEDTKKGVESIYNSKRELDSTQKNASTDTADEVLEEVIETYKSSMADATRKINHIACNYWENNSKLLKEELIDIVTVSDALSEKQKQTLSELIFNYKNVSFDDNASSIFVKPKFLHGHLLGLDLFTVEKLNIRKLAKEYNKTVEKNIETIATDMNENYYNSYKKWQDELSTVIEKNIVELNPELQVLSDSIVNETEKISNLEKCCGESI